MVDTGYSDMYNIEGHPPVCYHLQLKTPFNAGTCSGKKGGAFSPGTLLPESQRDHIITLSKKGQGRGRECFGTEISSWHWR